MITTEFPLAMMEAENEKRYPDKWMEWIKGQIAGDYLQEKAERPDLTFEYYLITRLIYAGPKTWHTVLVDDSKPKMVIPKTTTNRFRDGTKA